MEKLPHTSRIDWEFIAGSEGKEIKDGYVPSENSGVTIATGFDLGRRTVDELIEIGFPYSLIVKLKPYLAAQRAE